jgi:signal transduction histidine kinase
VGIAVFRVRKLEIAKKIILIVMLTTATALITAATGWVVYDRVQSRRDLEVSVRTLAGITADNLMASVSFQDQKAATDALNALQSDPVIVRGCVYSLSAPLAEFRRQGNRPCPQVPGPDGVFYEDEHVYVVRPILLNGVRRIGTLRLHASLEQLNSRLWRVLANAGLAIVLAAGVALILSSWLQQWISRPLRELTRATNAVAETNDYGIRAQRLTDDELGSLVDSINLMLSQIEAHHTEREQLLATEKEVRKVAEEANRLKDDFLRTLSHELRTPMTAIIGWASILKAGDLSAERFRSGLEAIARNAKVQTRLIDDLLDISRIGSGKFHLDSSLCDARQIVDAAVDSLRLAADAKKIRFAVHHNGAEHSLHCDAAKLQQAIANVLANAVKFTQKEGYIDVYLESDAAISRIVVRDNGMGINRDFLPYIFDRFRQADSSSTRHFGGLGLGLAIAREIVEMHTGTIQAFSDGPDRGSTFTIEIPRRASARRLG